MNSGKCHLSTSGKKCGYMLAKIGDDTKYKSRTVKLLGTTIDNKLKLYCHI